LLVSFEWSFCNAVLRIPGLVLLKFLHLPWGKCTISLQLPLRFKLIYNFVMYTISYV
jgi:hypothetical protein